MVDITVSEVLAFVLFLVINSISNARTFRRIVREEVPDYVYATLEAYDIEVSKLIEEEESKSK